MVICPKCDYASIDGPRFVSDHDTGTGRPVEALIYRCHRCGYEQAEQTVEQRKAKSREDVPR